MKRVRQTLCNQEQGLIGLGRVHLADCKRVSCRQGHAADGQFASDFQASAKPFRSFGSRAPSGSSFDVLQMAVAATENSASQQTQGLLSGSIHSGRGPQSARDVGHWAAVHLTPAKTFQQLPLPHG